MMVLVDLLEDSEEETKHVSTILNTEHVSVVQEDLESPFTIVHFNNGNRAYCKLNIKQLYKLLRGK